MIYIESIFYEGSQYRKFIEKNNKLECIGDICILFYHFLTFVNGSKNTYKLWVNLSKYEGTGSQYRHP